MSEQVNLGTSTDYYSGLLKQVGKDPDTGEKIFRQKTFTKCTLAGKGAMKIDQALIEVDAQRSSYINGNQPWNAVGAMLTEADLYMNRDDKGDRDAAYKMLCKVLVLSYGKDPVGQLTKIKEYNLALGTDITAADINTFRTADHPEVQEAQAKVAIAELVLNQLNDNQNTSVSIDSAIQNCVDARAKLNTMPDSEKDNFSIGKSCIVEAKLRALRNSTVKGDSDEAIIGLLNKARIDWETIKPQVLKNPYIVGDKKPAGLSNEVSLEQTRRGIEYLNAWADIEDAHLTVQKAKVAKTQEEAFKTEIANKIELCKKAQTTLAGIEKTSDYINHDAYITEANLVAKLARLKDDDLGLKDARTLYASIADKTAFNDIKALAITGKISLDIELGEFNWDTINSTLETYFDPGDDIKNKVSLKSQFDRGTFSYLSIETLEAQLRNAAKRTAVSVPGCDNCPVKGLTPDYILAETRANHVISALKTVKAVRDKSALTDQEARARLELARSMSIKAMGKDNAQDKIALLQSAIKELDNIITGVLKETEADILNNTGERKMESSFYVTLWGEKANYMEQIAWLQNAGKKVDMASFDGAIAKYNETIKLCAYSRAKYDNGSGAQSARQKLIQLSLDNISTAVTDIDVIASNADAAKVTIKALDDLIAKVDAFKVPTEITGKKAEKLAANVQRMKLEALCKKAFFINKQPSSFFGGQGGADKLISDLYDQIDALANGTASKNGILKDLDDTYYPVMNLLGVNSVYMRINKRKAVDAIVKLYTIIKVQKFETTYDMIDALANAAIINNSQITKAKGATSTLKDDVVTYLNALIGKTGTPDVSKAKAYVWSARMKAWFYNEKDLSNNDPKVLEGAVSDYDKALAIYGKPTTDAAKLYDNGASKLAVMEERSIARFMQVNATLNGDANVAARIGQYQLIAGDVKSIIDGVTVTTGMSYDVTDKVQKQDKAAKIKARLTMISMMMAISEPLSKGLLTDPTMVAAVTAICGQGITNENDLFAKTEEMFQSIKADMGTLGLTDTEMLNLGVDVPSVYARMAENYMILALKAMGPVKNIDDAVALKKEIEDLKTDIDNEIASGNSATSTEKLNANKKVVADALAKLNPVLTGAQSKKSVISVSANKYMASMNQYLNDALNKAKADSNSSAQAKVLLFQAEYAGWTGGTDKASYDKAKGLYESAKTLNPGGMDMKAELEYANVLSVISFMNKDVTLPAGIVAIYEKVKADNSALGAKACIELANLQTAFAKENASELVKARDNIYEALKKLTGSAKQTSMEYIDAVNAMIAAKKPIDKSIFQALCYLGVIEARLYTLKPDADRLAGYAAIKGILGGIGNVTGGINKIIKDQKVAGEPSLKLVVMDFTHFQDAVVKSWVKAGGDKTLPESIKAMNPTMSYDARVEDAIKKLSEIK
jgi:hypothetical protein